MGADLPNRVTASRDNDDNGAAVQELLESPRFRKAPALRSLLIYLWRNHDRQITEYDIAVEALERRPDFDPRIDATARVHVSRLRQKLNEYYAAEGAGSRLVVTIPVGAHQLEIRRAPAVVKELPAPPPAMEPAAAEPRRSSRLVAGLALLLLGASAAAVLLWRDNASLRAGMRGMEHGRTLPPLWQRFIGGGKPVRIVFANPVFYRAGDLRVRDVRINELDPHPSSDILQRAFGGFRPHLNQTYAVASDTLAAVALARFLEGRGVQFSVGGAPDLSLEFFGSHNLLLIGSPHTSRLVERYLERTNFRLRRNMSMVINRQPLEDEPAEYRPEPPREYGLITLIPGHAPDTRLFLVNGINTAALASVLVSPVLEPFQRLWESQGSPDWFQMVVEMELHGSSVTAARPKALRRVDVSGWK